MLGCDPDLLLARQSFGAHDVPPPIVHAPIAQAVLLLRMVWRMGDVRGEIEEEGLLAIVRP